MAATWERTRVPGILAAIDTLNHETAGKIAVTLMLVGIAMVGAVIVSVTAWVVAQVESDHRSL